MSNPFHTSYTVTQKFGPTDFASEPSYTWNGVYYQRFHLGLDMVGPSDTCPIYAIMPGTVFAAGTDTDGANYVIVQSPNYFVAFWHLSAITCQRGQYVDTNTQIGNQGTSGNSTAPHLHLQLMQADHYGHGLNSTGTPVDPTPYLTDTQGDPHDDMTNEQAVLAGLVAIQHIDPATYPPAALAGHVSRVNNGTPLATLYAEFIRDAGLLDNEDYNHRALREYYQANGFGDKADQTAIDRVQGGSNFAEVITGDLAHDHAAAEQTNNLYHAAVTQFDTFSQAIHDLQNQVATLNEENQRLHISLEKTEQPVPPTDQTTSDPQPAAEPDLEPQPDQTTVEDPASQPEPAKLSYLAGLYYIISRLFLGR